MISIEIIIATSYPYAFKFPIISAVYNPMLQANGFMGSIPLVRYFAEGTNQVGSRENADQV